MQLNYLLAALIRLLQGCQIQVMWQSDSPILSINYVTTPYTHLQFRQRRKQRKC